MNILLINHYAGSEHHGMEFRPFYLAREWVRLGHKVSIVAASFSHLRQHQPEIEEKSSQEYIDGVRFIWLKTPSYKGNGFARLINTFSFTKGLYDLREDVLDMRPDAIIASSPHPFIIYPAAWLRKKFGGRLIFEVRDLWPLSLIELANFNSRHPFIIFMEHAEDFAFRTANRVISLLPMASEFMEAHGMAPEKFVYIPNGVVTDAPPYGEEVLPKEHERFFSKVSGKFTVVFTGTFAEASTLDVLLSAASQMRKENVHFVLVGDGSLKQSLLRLIADNHLKNVSVLLPVRKELVPRILAKIDVAFIGWRKKPIYRFGVSPNKLFDYMMAGRPVIHAIEAGNDPVAESGCGISIAPEDPKAVADAIIQLMQKTPDERKAIGLKGREYVLANHDYRILANRFLDALR